MDDEDITLSVDLPAHAVSYLVHLATERGETLGQLVRDCLLIGVARRMGESAARHAECETDRERN